MKPTAQRMTVPRFSALKAAGQKITMLTAYDYSMAALLDATGIEGILVRRQHVDGRAGASQHAAGDAR